MHEIGVVRAMLKTVTDYAAAKGVSRVSEIVCLLYTSDAADD